MKLEDKIIEQQLELEKKYPKVDKKLYTLLRKNINELHHNNFRIAGEGDKVFVKTMALVNHLQYVTSKVTKVRRVSNE